MIAIGSLVLQFINLPSIVSCTSYFVHILLLLFALKEALMKTLDLKNSVLPHVIAILIFVALSYIYLLPLLQGEVLAQHDYTQAMGQQHEITEYVDKTGDQTLWTNSMFSGMPTVQIWLDYPTNLIGRVYVFMQNIFVNETDILFFLMIGVYLTLYPLTKNVWISTAGAVAFAFGSFNMISIEAGHLNKVLAMAFMAPIIGGIILAYQGRWLAGALLTGFFLAIQIRAGHIQITYYTLIAGAILALFFAEHAIVKKHMPLFIKATAALAIASMLAVGTNTAQLWGSYDYSHATIRGGKSELSNVKEEDKKGGLTKDYAFNWSQGIGETMTILIPNLAGGGSSGNYEGTKSYDKMVALLKQNGYPQKEAEKVANQIAGSELYWGTQPFTSGPIYFGAIVCFLFVLGMFVIKHPVKWALLGIAMLTVMLAWGNNFQAFNYFVFDYLPMYNKFRTPTMILTITNLIFVLVGFLALKEIWETKDRDKTIKQLKIAAGITGGILVLFAIGAGIFFDFKGLPKGQEYIDAATKMADRKGLLRADAFRSLLLVLGAAGIVWAMLTDKLKKQYAVAIIGILILGDLWTVSKRYLNDDDFVSKSEYDQLFIPSAADLAVLQDRDLSYRVLDFAGGAPFTNASTSYFHKSIGGYHAAKLRTYQELIENQISKDLATLQQGLGKGAVPENIPVLNMLNARYIMTGKKATDVIRNPHAAGNAWFVENVLTVNSADEELFGLSNIDTRKTAIVRNTFADQLAGFNPTPDSKGSIELTEYKPDELKYTFKSSNKELVVFSEVYYPDGTSWKAFIDGNPVEHLRANYVLRALVVPAGEHTIEFKFEPTYYKLGSTLSLVASLLMFAGLGAFIYLRVKKGDTFNA